MRDGIRDGIPRWRLVVLWCLLCPCGFGFAFVCLRVLHHYSPQLAQGGGRHMRSAATLRSDESSWMCRGTHARSSGPDTPLSTAPAVPVRGAAYDQGLLVLRELTRRKAAGCISLCRFYGSCLLDCTEAPGIQPALVHGHTRRGDRPRHRSAASQRGPGRTASHLPRPFAHAHRAAGRQARPAPPQPISFPASSVFPAPNTDRHPAVRNSPLGRCSMVCVRRPGSGVSRSSCCRGRPRRRARALALCSPQRHGRRCLLNASRVLNRETSQ